MAYDADDFFPGVKRQQWQTFAVVASTVLQRNVDTTTTPIDTSLYLKMSSISVLSIISGGSSDRYNTEIVDNDNNNYTDGSEDGEPCRRF